jgi:hypothetical protein
MNRAPMAGVQKRFVANAKGSMPPQLARAPTRSGAFTTLRFGRSSPHYLSGKLCKGGAMRSLFLGAICSLIATAAIGKERMLLVGIGVETCGRFAESYRHNPDSELIYFTWAQGFLAGQNAVLSVQKHSTRDLFGMPVESQKAVVRDYCDGRPLSLYWVAVMALYSKLPVVAVPKISN